MIVELPIRSVRVDGELQPRDHVNEDVAKRYAETMMEGLWDYAKSSSPIIVFHDGTDHWLADGFHRVIAAQLAGWSEIEVERRTGTQRDAKWFSFSANTAHGYPRGRSDVQRILKAIFTDEDWSKVSLRDIARHADVPKSTVARARDRYLSRSGQIQAAQKAVTRRDKTYTMDTANIGRRKDEEGPVEEAEGEELVTYDPETGKFHDPWKGPRRDENERRKLLSLHIIHTLEFWRDLPVPPEQAVREFFVHLAHDVDPSLEPGHRNLTAFMDAWRSK